MPPLNARDARVGEWVAGELKTVTVIGLRDQGHGEESDCDARDLTMLLRLQGPEAIAEVNLFNDGVFRYPLWKQYGSKSVMLLCTPDVIGAPSSKCLVPR